MSEKKSKLAVIKTQPTTTNVIDYINTLPNQQKKDDCTTLLNIMQKATGYEPVLWSNSIIGFGNKRYKSTKTGREVDWFLIGFAARKTNIVVYLTVSIKDYSQALEQLGKHKTGVGCLYINKLDDIHLNILADMITASLKKQ